MNGNEEKCSWNHEGKIKENPREKIGTSHNKIYISEFLWNKIRFKNINELEKKDY
uniref:Uncharacterized protein n=1 Tax=Meloidogyne enterolobii TaxID=390850 RepID=A0A6V7X086_MELEN|nr:unnamed protein product [Meloidogyne enterolobii]